MSVWFCIPSARPAVEAEPVLAKWRTMGYKIALLRQGEFLQADLCLPTIRWFEAGFVPGYRKCDECGRCFFAKGDNSAPILVLDSKTYD